MDNHYKYLEDNFPPFFELATGLNYSQHGCGLIVADGDKCSQYRDEWEEAGVPFNHGCMLYLISKYAPYSTQCRNTPTGWVTVGVWVVSAYSELKYLIKGE